MTASLVVDLFCAMGVGRAEKAGKLILRRRLRLSFDSASLAQDDGLFIETLFLSAVILSLSKDQFGGLGGGGAVADGG
jgi:hypothetical protein